MESPKVVRWVATAIAVAVFSLSAHAGAESGSEHERGRVSASLEVMPLSFQTVWMSGVSHQTVFDWGTSALGMGADVRLIAGLEAGLGVSYSVMHGQYDTSLPSPTIRTTTTASSFSTTPRVGYRVGLGADVDLLPRVGLRFAHSTWHMQTSGSGTTLPPTDGHNTSTWLVSGVLIRAGLADRIFASAGPELSVRLGGSSDGSTGALPDTSGDVHALTLGLVLGVGVQF